MQINNFVYVMHPERGSVCLRPGEVPEWAEPLITNRSAISSEQGASGSLGPISSASPPQGSPAGEAPGEGDPSAGVEGGTEDQPAEVPIPPKGGRGGSATKWAEYAASKGFEIDADATAAEIREALEAEGVPTE